MSDLARQEKLDFYLSQLSKSKFRSSFHLSEKERLYIKEKGMEKMISDTKDFIEKRLSIYPTPNDGKQTPYRGHPTFIAQHATACCCRGCLEKWYHIPKNRPLTKSEENFCISIIMAWIIKQMK